MGAVLEVGGDPERPTFTFGRPGLHLNRRLDFPGSLTVRKVGAGEIVWHVNENRPCPPQGIGSVRYGEPPPGATFVRGARPDARDAAPLVPGVVYTVSLSGCGYVGGVTFAIIDGKLISEPGNGDLPLRKMHERLRR